MAKEWVLFNIGKMYLINLVWKYGAFYHEMWLLKLYYYGFDLNLKSSNCMIKITPTLWSFDGIDPDLNVEILIWFVNHRKQDETARPLLDVSINGSY